MIVCIMDSSETASQWAPTNFALARAQDPEAAAVKIPGLVGGADFRSAPFKLTDLKSNQGQALATRARVLAGIPHSRTPLLPP